MGDLRECVKCTAQFCPNCSIIRVGNIHCEDYVDDDGVCDYNQTNNLFCVCNGCNDSDIVIECKHCDRMQPIYYDGFYENWLATKFIERCEISDCNRLYFANCCD